MDRTAYCWLQQPALQCSDENSLILFSHVHHKGAHHRGALLPVSPRLLARHSLERWCCSEAGALLLTKTGRMYFFNPKLCVSCPVRQGQQSSLVLHWGQCFLSAADLIELTTLKRMRKESCGSRATSESGGSPLLESGACGCWRSPCFTFLLSMFRSGERNCGVPPTWQKWVLLFPSNEENTELQTGWTAAADLLDGGYRSRGIWGKFALHFAQAIS